MRATQERAKNRVENVTITGGVENVNKAKIGRYILKNI